MHHPTSQAIYFPHILYIRFYSTYNLIILVMCLSLVSVIQDNTNLNEIAKSQHFILNERQRYVNFFCSFFKISISRCLMTNTYYLQHCVLGKVFSYFYIVLFKWPHQLYDILWSITSFFFYWLPHLNNWQLNLSYWIPDSNFYSFLSILTAVAVGSKSNIFLILPLDFICLL